MPLAVHNGPGPFVAQSTDFSNEEKMRGQCHLWCGWVRGICDTAIIMGITIGDFHLTDGENEFYIL